MVYDAKNTTFKEAYSCCKTHFFLQLESQFHNLFWKPYTRMDRKEAYLIWIFQSDLCILVNHLTRFHRFLRLQRAKIHIWHFSLLLLVLVNPAFYPYSCTNELLSVHLQQMKTDKIFRRLECSILVNLSTFSDMVRHFNKMMCIYNLHFIYTCISLLVVNYFIEL